jgi:hypothetical protein
VVVLMREDLEEMEDMEDLEDLEDAADGKRSVLCIAASVSFSVELPLFFFL